MARAKIDIDNKGKTSYNKKRSYYSQFNTLATSWASNAEKGELFAGYDGNSYRIVIATGDDYLYENYKTVDANNDALIEYYEEFIKENNERIQRESQEIRKLAESITLDEGFYDNYSSITTREPSNVSNGRVFKRESQRNGERNTEESSRNQRGVKSSSRALLDVNFAEKANKQSDTQEKTAEKSTGKLAAVRYNVDTNVFEIGKNSELAKRIQNSKKSKYTVIKEYLVEMFGNTTFTLSDGKKAIMDNRDAQELSHKADALRTAELADLKNLVEKAEYIGDPKTVEHPKFDAFSYYKIKVAYEGNQFEILINVGRAKNDKTYHIYAITNYNEKGAVGLLKNNPSRPVGNAIKDGSFNTIIRENSEKSTQNAKNSSKNSNERFSIDVNSPKADFNGVLRQYLHRIDLTKDIKQALVEKPHVFTWGFTLHGTFCQNFSRLRVD